MEEMEERRRRFGTFGNCTAHFSNVSETNFELDSITGEESTKKTKNIQRETKTKLNSNQ